MPDHWRNIHAELDETGEEAKGALLNLRENYGPVLIKVDNSRIPALVRPEIAVRERRAP